MRRALWTGLVFLAGLGVGAGTFAARAAGPARRYINLPGRAVAAPFSDAVLVGDTLYLAGRIGFKPGTRQVPDTPEEEARLVLDDYKKVLAEAGIPTAGLRSKGLKEIDLAACRLLVNLSGHSPAASIPAPLLERVLQRPVVDPYGCGLEVYRQARDAIYRLVRGELAGLLRSFE